MTGDEIGYLAYLAIFGVVMAGWLLASNRGRMGQMAKYAGVWVFLFLGAVVVAGLWTDIRGEIRPRQNVIVDGSTVEVPRSVDGHYYLTLDVNGAPIRFVVDTGASQMVLSREDAARAGLDTSDLIFSSRAFTANGMVDTAPVLLQEVTLAGVTDRGVRAVVNGGQMPESLLGMSYLQRFNRLEIADGTLVLER